MYRTRVTHKRGNSMLKLARLGAATLLGLFMALTLFVPGAFAQSVHAQYESAALKPAQAHYKSAGNWQTLSANWRWHHFRSGWGGGWWDGGGWDGGGWWSGGWGDGCGC